MTRRGHSDHRGGRWGMGPVARMKYPVLLLVLAGAGCASTDPYQRPGMWHPAGVNDANLRAMVAVPSDLVVGAPSGPGGGGQAAAALDRARHDRVRPLPASAIAKIGPPATAAAPPAGAETN